MNTTGIDGYRDYLARRDGDADLLNRRLTSREEFFAALEADPVRSKHLVDPREFAHNLRRRATRGRYRPEGVVSPRDRQAEPSGEVRCRPRRNIRTQQR
jgi:hypothetical protein